MVKSTGVNRMMEYMEGLDDYKVWATDYQAPKEYVASNLNRGQYRYLLENSLGSMSFVDSLRYLEFINTRWIIYR